MPVIIKPLRDSEPWERYVRHQKVRAANAAKIGGFVEAEGQENAVEVFPIFTKLLGRSFDIPKRELDILTSYFSNSLNLHALYNSTEIGLCFGISAFKLNRLERAWGLREHMPRNRGCWIAGSVSEFFRDAPGCPQLIVDASFQAPRVGITKPYLKHTAFGYAWIYYKMIKAGYIPKYAPPFIVEQQKIAA